MSNAQAIQQPAQPHFEVHRSLLAEAGADAALAAAWLLLWLVFVLALAPSTPARDGLGGAGACDAAIAACRVETGASAQPEPGASSRGVAPAERGGAG